VLYILKSGRLAQETVVYIEEQNKYPTGLSKWELQTTKRKVQFELRKIRENEIFGH